MRLRLAVVLLACAATAGCTGMLDLGSGATSTAEPETPTTVPPPPPPETAEDPGLGVDGVVDPVALSRAHADHLQGRSFTYREATTIRDENGTVLLERELVVRVGVDRERFELVRQRTVAGGAPSWIDPLAVRYPPRAYGNGTGVVVVDDRFSGDPVRRYDDPSRSSVAGHGFVGTQLIYETFGGVETRTTDVRREDDELVLGVSLAEAPVVERRSSEPNITVSLDRLDATIERDGFVRSIEREYDYARDGRTLQVTRRHAYTDVGETTVERPAWVDDALANESGAGTPAGSGS